MTVSYAECTSENFFQNNIICVVVQQYYPWYKLIFFLVFFNHCQ